LEAIKEDEHCSGAHAWASILFAKVSNGIQETIQNATKIRSHAERAADLDPHDPVPRFVIGAWCFTGASLDYWTKLFARNVLGDVPDSTFEESLQFFEKSLELWTDDSHRPAYLPAAPWRSLLTYLARTYAKLGRKSEAAEMARRALSSPPITGDEGADTDAQLKEVCGELSVPFP
jgi:tetratricopeptide (TPR) repeat protein